MYKLWWNAGARVREERVQTEIQVLTNCERLRIFSCGPNVLG